VSHGTVTLQPEENFNSVIIIIIIIIILRTIFIVLSS